MKENLRVSKYRNGEVIPVSSDNVQWSNLNKGSRCWYENDSVLFNLPYGNLYNLYAVIDDKKLCPNGWHIPTDTEWNILTLFLGGENIAGGKMKSVGTTYWNSPNTGATNESGFTGFPGGFRDSNGSFKNGKLTSFFWSSTIYDLDYARNRGLDHNGANIFKYTIGYKTVGASVRCLKD
jgi:uncharacterized protein (TIGR02145 family)